MGTSANSLGLPNKRQELTGYATRGDSLVLPSVTRKLRPGRQLSRKSLAARGACPAPHR